MRLVAFVLTAFFAFATGARAANDSIHLSSGIVIGTPPVAGMTCDELSAKLSEIDETGYRGNSPEPRNPDDQPLLTYEEDAATAFYESCVMRALGRKQPSAAFSDGYRGDK